MNVPQLRFEGFDGDWKIHQLKEYFDFIDGDRGPNYPNEDDFNSEGHCVFLNAHNISENGLIFNRINWLSEEIHRKLRKGTVERGDLILTSRGSKLGKLALYDEKVPFEIMRINSAMLLIRKKRSELDSNYSLYLFKESLLPKFINANKVGSAQPHITVKDIKRLNFSKPQDISEQKKIAHFFGLLNQRIEKQQEVIEKLEQFKKGMMQKIFSQELRFKDEDGGEFPQWRRTTLKDEVDIFNNMRKPVTENIRQKGQYPYYGATGIIDYVQDYIFDGEYLLLAEDGANIVTRSAPVVYKTKDKFWVNNHAHIMKPKANNDFNFFYQVLENINYIPYNSGTAQPKLNVESIKKIPLKIPIHHEQKKIGMILLTLDSKIEKEKEKLMSLEEQKKGFMQGMFV